MSRFTRKIKNKNEYPIQVIILCAGAGARTKSYEPRCLLKYNNESILDKQIAAIQKKFMKAEISVVGGIEGHKIIKKIGKSARYIENQIFDDSNSGESLRLAVNNSLIDNILFLHGDLIFEESLLNFIDINNSCVLIDSNGSMEEKEVGVTFDANKNASIFSYNLPTKWCQVAYLNSTEVLILRKILLRNDIDFKYLLTFEILNKLIEFGGNMKCIDIKNTFIKEIDSLKDINSENNYR